MFKSHSYARKRKEASSVFSKNQKERKINQKKGQNIFGDALDSYCAIAKQYYLWMALSKRLQTVEGPKRFDIGEQKVEKSKQKKTFKSSSKWIPHFFSKDANFLNCHLLGDLFCRLSYKLEECIKVFVL